MKTHRPAPLALICCMGAASVATVAYNCSAISAEMLQRPSISLLNPQNNIDADTIKTFADAFNWASGIRTNLIMKGRGELNVLYVPDFEFKQNIDIRDEIIKKFYEEHFDTIRDNGECGMSTFNVNDSEKFYVLYVTPRSKDENRLTCIYSRFRSLFNLSPNKSLKSFEDTFVSDIVTLHCRKIKTEFGEDRTPADPLKCLGIIE